MKSIANQQLRLAGHLFANGVRYRLRQALRQPGTIQALSLEVTHRCICHCIMCNIWKIPHQVEERPMSAWSDLLADPCFEALVELDITGGEPFLKTDLVSLFETINTLTRTHLKRLKSIAITTNAILTRQVLETTKAILATLDGTGIQLVLACAMDAVDDRHDRIRGYSGAFEKMQTTLTELMALRERHPNLILGIKTTILPANVDQLPQIDAFARSRGLFSIISPCIITGGRYLNQDRRTDLAFTPHQIDQMIQFFSRDDHPWSHHAKALKDYLQSGKTRRRCSCGFNYAFIRSTGAVHLCPLLPQSVGSIARDRFSDVWRSSAARDLRGTIGRSPACRHCTEPGLQRYALIHEGWAYLRLFLRMGGRRFERFHAHMGLNHYYEA